MALDGGREDDARRVDPVLEAGRAGEADVERLALMLVEHVEAGHVTAIALIDHVAVLLVVEEEGEVVEQGEHVVGAVRVRADELVVGRPPPPIEIDVGSLGAAALVGVDRVEAPDEARPYRAGRDLARAVPVGLIVRSPDREIDRKSTRLNSSHVAISYAVFCLKKKT